MHASVALRRIGLFSGLSVALVATAATVASPARADDAPQPPTAPAAAGAPAPAETPQHPAKAEDESESHLAPNSVYAEGLGAGLVYSLNYERMVLDDLGVRVGFGYTSWGVSAGDGANQASASVSLLTIPVTASYVGIRHGSSALELGGGATIAIASAGGSSFVAHSSGSGAAPYAIAMVGYRLHPVNHAGFQFRVGAMAVAGPGLGFSTTDPGAFGVIPWLYLSLGASF